MESIFLLGCSVTTRNGTQIPCSVAVLLVALALGIRLVPRMLQERPPPPPLGAPLQNQDAMNSGGFLMAAVLLVLLGVGVLVLL